MIENQYTLSTLPKSFYRVSVKALIFNKQQELLIFKNEDNKWEIPGGGWEFGESLADCVRRELHEEVRATLLQVSEILFAYASKHEKGYTKLCLVVRADITDDTLVPTEDGIVEALYASKEAFKNKDFHYNERAVLDYADTIWSETVIGHTSSQS